MLKSLEERVASLEARVRLLESAPAATADPCPACGGRLLLTDERDHPTFGVFGVKERVFTCEACSRTVTRRWEPSQG